MNLSSFYFLCAYCSNAVSLRKLRSAELKKFGKKTSPPKLSVRDS